ncbi:hypothetical protein BJX64DRAFT_293138 [Aspergillus heterothallicus]
MAMGDELMTTAVNPNDLYVAAACVGITLYIVVELFLWMFAAFERHGLYFYSYLVATVAQAIFTSMACIILFSGTPHLAVRIILALSFGTLVNAIHFVIYARLHLVLPHSPRFLRAILVILIVSTIAILGYSLFEICSGTGCSVSNHTGTTVTTVLLTAREMCLCAIYVVQAVRQVQSITLVKGEAGRRVLIELIVAQAFVVLVDVGFIVVVFKASLVLRTGYMCIVHAVQLRVECAILNSLKRLLTSPAELIITQSLSPSCEQNP